MDRGPAHSLGVGVLQEGVAAGTDSNGYELTAATAEDVCEIRSKQHAPHLRNDLSELRLHRRDRAVGVEFRHDQRVCGEPVATGVPARQHADHVGPGHRWENGVVVLARDT